MKGLRFIISIPVLVVIIAAPSFAGEWHIETVDTAGVMGWYTSIAVDFSDNPHISYHDHSNYYLKYAYYDGSSWQTEVIDPVWSHGEYTSIALDSGGNPHISNYAWGNLKYAYHDGSSWHIETVDTGVLWYTSIALDSAGNPHISYYEYYNADLRYAYYDGSSWQVEAVETVGSVGEYTSIALDSGGNPHVSYYDYSNGNLKYAYYDGSSWQTEAVDTIGNVGEYTSIALDSGDNPHISYYDNSNDDLKYAYYDGSNWQIESVDTVGSVGEYTSIAVDSGGKPHISYYDDSNRDLKYAYYDGSSWQIEAVDTAGRVGHHTSIALDSGNNPHISYHFGSYEDLKYAWYEPDDVGITVKYFSAASAAAGVEVSWECGDEVSGFNLYRSVGTGEGKAAMSRDKLNAELITGASPYSYLDTAVDEGVTYNYWLEAIDVGGSSETFGPVDCTWNGTLPATYALYQSRPNPASGRAVIAFDLPENVEVTLTVYDISGRKVTTLVDRALPAGEHAVDVTGLAAGVYVYKLSAGSFSAAKKMVVQ
jgi:hypothetical protein